MPAVKGQKFKQYSFEIKMEALHLHLVEDWTYRRIMEECGVTDRPLLKDWMKSTKNPVSLDSSIIAEDARHTLTKTDR
ncbi:hypothetical protein [Paenibacillus xylanexedens]|uniref:hypothetical protein n=1 Tax=Paenibacillus xylanexedens TaxID=528191 RepID=UPI003CFE0BF8